MFRFDKILWVKSVTMEEGVLAYPGRVGAEFALHCTPEDQDSLGDPAVGDIVVLTQHGQVTHLDEAGGQTVEPRAATPIRSSTRDARFSVQRTFVHRMVLDLERAPFLDEAFGFDPQATGGEVFLIAELPAFLGARVKLWMVQRRIHQSMS